MDREQGISPSLSRVVVVFFVVTLLLAGFCSVVELLFESGSSGLENGSSLVELLFAVELELSTDDERHPKFLACLVVFFFLPCRFGGRDVVLVEVVVEAVDVVVLDF